MVSHWFANDADLRETRLYFIARDGDTEDSLAQEPHETQVFLSLPVLRSAGLSNIPGDGKYREVMLLTDVQMFLCPRGRVEWRVL